MFEFILCKKFSKYSKMGGTGIEYEKRAIGEFVKRHYSSDTIFCMLECEKYSACELVTYDTESSCTLYNEDITLVHTTKLTNSTIYSKKVMEMCKKNFYYDKNDHACYAKKLGSGIEACDTSVECREDKNLTCTEKKVCECLFPLTRL